jgi:cytochrome P450
MRKSGAEATEALQAYCGEQLEKRRHSGDASDLLGVLATTEVQMTDQEKRSYVTVFLEGAQDTTSKFTTTTLATLAQHPDQRKALVEDRDLMPQALDEVMRWGGPVNLDPRIARGPGVRIGDVPIPEGSSVSLALGAANRDPSRWENPHDFNIFRPSKSHLGFGFGIHSCMGVNLARLIASTIMNKVLDAAPEYKLATEELEYGRSFVIRGPKKLPLCL